MRRNRAAVTLLALVLPLGALAGCGYSLAGRGDFLPAYIRTIAVPQFTNATPVLFDVERRITERVQAELIGRGRYRVEPVQRAGADAVLTGSISSITVVPVAFDQQKQPRYVLTLTAQIEFKDLKTDKVLWSNPSMQFREEFEPTTGATVADAADFFDQDANALDRIATEFARSVVSALLEAF